MVGSLRTLDVVKCRNVLVLPLKPPHHAPAVLIRCGPQARHTEPVAVVHAFGPREPLPVAFGDDDAMVQAIN